MKIRDQQWLEERLVRIWQKTFPDLVPANQVVIRFGRAARVRLGSIRMSRDKKISKILINKLFQNLEVPVEVVDATIAHELTHYLHGFSSPLEQKFSTPHAGGIVTKELKKRGFARILEVQKKWLKNEWPKFLKQYGPKPRRRTYRRRRRGLITRKVLKILG